MSMSRLCLACVTVLLALSVSECSQTYRCAMEMEDRHQSRVYAEYVRKNPAPWFPIPLLPTPSPTPPKKEGTTL